MDPLKFQLAYALMFLVLVYASAIIYRTAQPANDYAIQGSDATQPADMQSASPQSAGVVPLYPTADSQRSDSAVIRPVEAEANQSKSHAPKIQEGVYGKVQPDSSV